MVLPIVRIVDCLAANEVVTVTITAAGTDYVEDEIVTVTGGAGSGATIKVLTVDTGGEILTAEVLAAGTGYEPADALTQASTTGVGVNAEFEVDTLISRSDIIELDKAGPFSVSIFVASGAISVDVVAVPDLTDDSIEIPLVAGSDTLTAETAGKTVTIASPVNRVRMKNTDTGAAKLMVVC
jgi:hypothetical protein